MQKQKATFNNLKLKAVNETEEALKKGEIHTINIKLVGYRETRQEHERKHRQTDN